MPSTRTSAFSERKRESVLDAAKRSFLARGFAATNLDEVADGAGVSKMTIYSHFGSKENLFMQVLERVIADHSAGGPALDPDVEPSDLHDALVAVASDLVATVQDPEVVGLRRVLVAEQPRQPGLASAWRRSAVLATLDELAAYFASLQHRGLLSEIEPDLLAAQFLWMLIGDPLDAALLDPESTRTTPQDQAAHAVMTLLAAYAGSEVPVPVKRPTRRRA